MSFGFGFGFPKNYVAALFNTPASLFTTGVNGAWYDPSDFRTLFQDAAGTTPVTSVGQPVGRILDKSGRSNHAYNPSGNSANFPVLQQDGSGRYYLSFNGVNQWLRTVGSIDLTYGDKVFVSTGVKKLSDTLVGVAAEFSANVTTNNGSFTFVAPRSTTLEYGIYWKGTVAAVTTSLDYSDLAAPNTSVISFLVNLSGITQQAVLSARVNSVERTLTYDTASLGGGNFGNYPLYIGARAGTSTFAKINLYGFVVAGKAASASDIASTEVWLNQKTGAY